MSGEDRADRLRRRRQRARDRALADEVDEADESDESDESVKPAKTEETARTEETTKAEKSSESGGLEGSGEREGNDEANEPSANEQSQLSVKDEQKPTYMYLPHSVRRDLDRAYSILKAEYEYEYEESFEKNRHFYPLVVSLGLEAVDELDAEDVRSRLEEGL